VVHHREPHFFILSLALWLEINQVIWNAKERPFDANYQRHKNEYKYLINVDFK
jgi:hypothetical protein